MIPEQQPRRVVPPPPQTAPQTTPPQTTAPSQTAAPRATPSQATPFQAASPWASAPARPKERATSRLRKVVEGLPDWEPLPPGEMTVRRPKKDL
ncbi:hypothetical protein ACFWAA_25360 [Streptomyces sp. NPDC059922]|uniref:hypothetical protein n=1 Tax=Streptomyces sp. NPDC059922 TaxID=3347005 RepID=UPI0036546A58